MGSPGKFRHDNLGLAIWGQLHNAGLMEILTAIGFSTGLIIGRVVLANIKAESVLEDIWVLSLFL